MACGEEEARAIGSSLAARSAALPVIDDLVDAQPARLQTEGFSQLNPDIPEGFDLGSPPQWLGVHHNPSMSKMQAEIIGQEDSAAIGSAPMRIEIIGWGSMLALQQGFGRDWAFGVLRR